MSPFITGIALILRKIKDSDYFFECAFLSSDCITQYNYIRNYNEMRENIHNYTSIFDVELLEYFSQWSNAMYSINNHNTIHFQR